MKTKNNAHIKLSIFSTCILSALCGCNLTSGGSETINLEDVKATQVGNNTICYGNTNNDEILNKKCDLRIYQVMVESFRRSNDSNQAEGYSEGYGPSNHNGTIKGIIESIPYIKSLGMNTIWLTPIFDSSSCGSSEDNTKLDATGYFSCDLTKVDPKFGTEEDLKNLVDTAHDNGLYVILDGVFGHFKRNVATSGYINAWNKKIFLTKNCRTMEGVYRNIDEINPFGETSPYYCADFTKDETIEAIKKIAIHYIKEFKIDGWRLDQAYQLTPDTWRVINNATDKAFKETTYLFNGKKVNPLGYMVGEVWGWSNNIAKAYDGRGAKKAAIESIFDFPLRYRITQTIARNEHGDYPKNSGDYILDGFKQTDEYPDTAMPNYFLTNHDLVRFANLIKRGYESSSAFPWISKEMYLEREKAALSVITLASGPITNYYGEERGQFIKDYVNPEDLGYYDDNASRDNGIIELDPNVAPTNNELNPFGKEMRKYFTQLMNFRANSKALSRGAIKMLVAEDSVFGAKKTLENEDVLYFLNVKQDTIVTLNIPMNKIGRKIAYLIDPITGTKYQAINDKFSITLQPLQNMFLIPESSDLLELDFIDKTTNKINFKYY